VYLFFDIVASIIIVFKYTAIYNLFYKLKNILVYNLKKKVKKTPYDSSEPIGGRKQKGTFYSYLI
tara:strand:+ start:2719 stop:2913 length:195 start_codon:yes stop_codon:yes gene_type:complete